MKRSFLLGLLFATTTSIYAQQAPSAQPTPAAAPSAAPATAPATAPTTPPAKDEWGTEIKPAVTTTDPATVPATDSAASAAAAPSGIEAALGGGKPETGSTAVKPMNASPKLNPNSSGTYDKRVVKTQNKRTQKVVAKRRHATARAADIRRGEQIQGIRRMEKGKIPTASHQR